MVTFKRLLGYIIWVVAAFLLAFIYVRIILGAKPVSSSFLMQMFGWFYEFAFLRLGLIIGSIVSLLFILIDVFYLKRKLAFVVNSTLIRLFALAFITLIIGIIHYVLEKVIDVI
uniref:hypothetical protein n=1 Tax=Gelidibacter sp. TaxID=2018083 RepID=UPI00404B3366